MAEKKFSFTEAYQEVEKINEWFLKDNVDLEEALEKYERGMELIKKCRERLKESENKFADIKKKYGEEK